MAAAQIPASTRWTGAGRRQQLGAGEILLTSMDRDGTGDRLRSGPATRRLRCRPPTRGRIRRRRHCWRISSRAPVPAPPACSPPASSTSAHSASRQVKDALGRRRDLPVRID